MSAPVLVHLIEPAAWRAALAVGAVRPPSLESAGFVHLSAPEQVHLPATRLFPGRRDLVLLVVDPTRLTAPLRFEPGHPDDPADLRFPHLYGPLPVTAVVAVVPYRPPGRLLLPTADDAPGRTRALLLSLHTRRAAIVRDVPGGVAVADARFPDSWDDNRLLLWDELAADTVAALAQRMGTELGWSRPAATLLWPGAHGVARELEARGWELRELRLMARATAPVPDGDRAQVVPQQEVHPLWERSWQELGLSEEVAAQLVEREYRNDLVVRVIDVVVKDGPRVAAAGQLRVDGATALVDSVLTDTTARGRGYADAVLARILSLAAEAGCDLVALEALAEDWPGHWYARRGFAEVGSIVEVLAPARRLRSAPAR